MSGRTSGGHLALKYLM